MAYIIPVDDSACNRFSISTDSQSFTFRTYWSGDVTKRWLCDIIDSDDNTMLSGVVLSTGINNLIQGSGIDTLAGWSLFVYDTAGTSNMTVDSLGNTATVYLVPPGEDFDYPYAVE